MKRTFALSLFALATTAVAIVAVVADAPPRSRKARGDYLEVVKKGPMAASSRKRGSTST